ncbi:hypothetical protein [Nocardioides sp.]|uniref:hypothetical protein n=1 Tax=Nocardioides sp. TaxID=35761 RepID=UPI00261F0F2A|nr:hypothetical protein [Nocardioides sp.]
MTSWRGPDARSSSGYTGHLRIQPALNQAERDHLRAVADSGGTLRGTPTGRGDSDVPFARLAWEACSSGCCLTWNPHLEESRMMLPTLQFLVDHLLRRGAKAEGRVGFGAFTFDHVLDGAVMGQSVLDPEMRLVEVAGNAASERVLPRGCDANEVDAPLRTAGRTRRGSLPKNVIEFRPRRA